MKHGDAMTSYLRGEIDGAEFDRLTGCPTPPAAALALDEEIELLELEWRKDRDRELRLRDDAVDAGDRRAPWDSS